MIGYSKKKSAMLQAVVADLLGSATRSFSISSCCSFYSDLEQSLFVSVPFISMPSFNALRRVSALITTRCLITQSFR